MNDANNEIVDYLVNHSLGVIKVGANRERERMQEWDGNIAIFSATEIKSPIPRTTTHTHTFRQRCKNETIKIKICIETFAEWYFWHFNWLHRCLAIDFFCFVFIRMRDGLSHTCHSNCAS